MLSTADKILSQANLTKKRDGSYHGNCPYRPESDSGAFILKIEDGEHGTYFDHARKEGGSLYDLALKMGIETPKARPDVNNTKIGYENLADYAERHFAPVEVFTQAGWADGEHLGRKALIYPVQSGTRARFIDGKTDEKGNVSNIYIWIRSNGNCWYGLDRAINKANQLSSPLILCNGEASTIVAQHYGIPAFCGTGGEGAVSKDMLQELSNRWHGQIIIALDCDTQGQRAAEKLQGTINKSLSIDLGLGNKGDLADYCGLYQHDSFPTLRRIFEKELDKLTVSPTEFIEFVDNYSLLSDFHKFVHDDPTLFGDVIRMPFKTMRKAGGFADLMTTKKVWFIGNESGGGKTIMSESLCDGWNSDGTNVVYIGDEWTPMEFIARQVQRATVGQAVSYMDYLHYVKGDKEFTQDEHMSIALASRAIRSRNGHTYVMKVADTFKNVVFLEDIMESLALKIDTLRANGISISVVILDYLSLYDVKESQGNNIEEYKAGLFKAWCKSLNVLGVSTVQVNKTSEDRVKSKGGFLTQHDLYWIRQDKGNLISTMNRIYKTNFECDTNVSIHDKRAHQPYLDENFKPIPTPNVCIVTAKNSVASPDEYSYMHFDFSHMKLTEGLAYDYEYNVHYGMVLPVGFVKEANSANYNDSDIVEHYAND